MAWYDYEEEYQAPSAAEQAAFAQWAEQYGGVRTAADFLPGGKEYVPPASKPPPSPPWGGFGGEGTMPMGAPGWLKPGWVAPFQASMPRPTTTEGIFAEFLEQKRLKDIMALATGTPPIPPLGTPTIPLPQDFPQTWTDGEGTIWKWDSGLGGYAKIGFDPSRVYQPPTPLTSYQEAQLALTKTKEERDALQQLWEREETGRQRAESQQWQQQQAGATQRWQQEQLAWWKQEQQAALEAQKQQQLASLRAQPASWLEYASLAGQTPAIQPWMLPLMSQQYQGATAGQALPGWQPSGASLAGLPELTQPSRQYQARAGPTAMAQYGGYEQARTGAMPSETEFRLWSSAPPSGAFPGLRWNR